MRLKTHTHTCTHTQQLPVCFTRLVTSVVQSSERMIRRNVHGFVLKASLSLYRQVMLKPVVLEGVKHPPSVQRAVRCPSASHIPGSYTSALQRRKVKNVLRISLPGLQASFFFFFFLQKAHFSPRMQGEKMTLLQSWRRRCVPCPSPTPLCAEHLCERLGCRVTRQTSITSGL